MDNQKLLSINDLFKKSFSFYKERLYLIMTLSLIPFANFVVISLLTELIDVKMDSTSMLVGLGIIFFLFIIFSVVVNLWVQMTYFYLIKEKDVTKDAKSLLLFSWSNIASYSWVLFLVGLVTMAGFILFIIPGILFVIWFSLSLYVFVFENMLGMKALYRSKELVKGYWWAVLGRLFIFGLIAGLINAIPVIGTIINIFFIMPLGVIYGYFIYENLKTLKG